MPKRRILILTRIAIAARLRFITARFLRGLSISKKMKNRLIQLNEKINWQPDHLKHGRFLNIVKDAPDWNISRKQILVSPLPIWKCQKCQKVELIGSLEGVKK